MRTVEERIADLEGQIRLYPQMFGALRDDIRQLRTEVHDGTGQTRGELAQVRSEMRVESGQLRGEMGQLRADMQQGFARLDDRMSRQFTWMVGIQVTTLLAVVGALLARG